MAYGPEETKIAAGRSAVGYPNGATPTQLEDRGREIPHQVEGVREALALLEKLLEEMELRLEPVLRPKMDQKMDQGPATAGRSPTPGPRTSPQAKLAVDLNAIMGQLERYSFHIDAMLGRLEI